MEASGLESRADERRERIRVVDLSEYCDLLVSRRRLERDERDRQRLFDPVSNELFVLRTPSAEPSSQSA